MAKEDLKIQIVGTLNVGKSIGEINTQIKAIEKSINKLKLNITIDDKVMGVFTNFNNQMKKLTASALESKKVIEEVINPDGSRTKRTYFDGLNGEFKETVKGAKPVTDELNKQVKSVKELENEFNKLTKSQERFNKESKKIGETDTLTNDDGTKTRVIRKDGEGNLTGFTDTTNLAKADQQTKELANSVVNLKSKYIDLAKSGNLTADELSKVSSAIYGVKDTSSLEKATQVYDQMADRAKLAEQMAKGREQATIKALNNETVAIQNQAKAQNKANDDINLKRQALIQQLNKLSNESKVTESSFGRLNNAVKTSQNIDQLNKLEKALDRVDARSKVKFDIGQYQAQAQLKAQNLTRTHGGHLDNAALESYLASVNALSTRTPNLNNQMAELNTKFNQISGNAKTAAGALNQAGMGLSEMLSTAAIKFPVWMLASTMFFAPIHAVQDMTSRLIELDTAMVGIKRVMDMPDFKFTELLNDAVNVSDELSSKLTDVLSIIGDFARMGFSEDELIDISKTGQVLQNISDLDATSAVDTLTSAMLNFNIAAEDSLQISDALNEVDNNYAITTKDLSDSIRKASSTAKTFGVDLQELIGYTAAIGSTTRESGAIIGNGLKTIFSRITTMSDAEDALKGVNISINDLSGNVKPVSDILDELGGKWSRLSDEQRQNLGVTLAGRYQLSRFLALMNNYELALNATETATNSQNSSMEEQAKYADSLEGRLNRLDTAWNKFTLSMGDAIMTDGLIVLVESLGDLAASSASFVDKFGAIPPLFLILGTSVALLSTRFRTLMSSIGIATWGVLRGQITATTATTVAQSAAVNTLSLSWKSFLASTGIGAAFLVIGFAIEKLTNHLAEAKKAQEEFEQTQQTNIEALTTNKQQTNELIESYKKLTQEKEKAGETWTVDKEKEYLKVQQQLGEVFPSLISQITTTGETRIKSINSIDQEIAATEKLIELKKEETRIKARDSIEDSKGDLDGFFTGLEGKIKRAEKRLKNSIEAGLSEELINENEQALLSLQNQYAQASVKINDEVLKIADAYSKLEISPSVSKSVQDFVYSMDLSKMDSSTLEKFSINIAKYSDAMQKALDKGNVGDFEAAQNSLRVYAKEIEASEVQLSNLNLTFEDAKKGNDLLANAVAVGSEGMDDYSESIDGTTESVDELVEAFDDSISNIESLNSIINELNDGNGLTADSMKSIMEIYPELLAYIDDETVLRDKIGEKIAQEEELAKKAMLGKLSASKETYQKMYNDNKIYIEGLKELKDVDLKNAKNLAHAKELIENKLLTSLSKKWGEYYDVQANAFTEQGKALISTMSYSEAVNNPMLKDIGNAQAQIKAISERFDDMTFESAGFNNLSFAAEGLAESTKKSTSASKEANSTIKDSIYYADVYKQSLEKLNLELEKQRAIKAKYPTHSKEHQNALKNEIALMEQQKKLTQDQANSLSKQISSGKIAPVGMVTTTSKSKSSSKQYTGKYADAINSASSKYGVDPYLIASIIKQESNFNPNAVSSAGATGLMQLMPATARGLGVKNSKEPNQNIMGGTKYIAQQLEKYSGDIQKALYAYNAGAGNVTKILNSSAGQWKEPKNYYNKVMSNYKNYTNGSYSSSSPTGETESASTKAAEAQQAIDQAKSDLLGLQNDIISYQDTIDALEIELINAQLSSFDNTRQNYQHTLDYEKAKQEAISKTGKEYRASIDKQITAMQGQQSANQKELNFINELVKKGGISANTMTTMKERAKALKIEMLQLGSAIENANFEKIQSRMTAFDESQDDLQFLINLSSEYMSTLQEGSEEYNRVATEQIATMEKSQRMIRTQIEEHQNDLKTKKLSVQATKDLKEKIEDLTTSYWSLEGSIKNTSESLKEANKQMNSELGDKLINSLKDVINEQKEAKERALEDERRTVEENHEAVLKQIDEQIDAENKAHEEKMDNIQENLRAYEKYIQAQIDGIDKVENKRTYEKDIDELQKEKNEIQSAINALAGDTSYEAKAKKKELNKQLEDVNDRLFERRNAREIELRKENYENLLETEKEKVEAIEKNETELHESRLENLEKLKEAEDKSYKARIKQIDDLKRYWDQYYTDQLNDERKFAKIRKDIVAGNFEDIKKEFDGHLSYLIETMPDLENTLDGTMQAVGTSIRQNMIDNLKEALDLLKQVQSNTGTGNSNSGQFNDDKNATNPPKNSGGSSDPQSLTGKITVTKPINLWKRKRGSNEMELDRILKAGETYKVYGYENKYGGQYDVGADRWITNMKDHIKFVPDKASALAGGMTSNWSGAGVDGKGGRDMTVHPNEIINNPLDSKRLLLSANVIEKTMSYLPKILLPKINNVNAANSNEGNLIIQFNVDKMTGSEDDVKSFTKQVARTLKRERGMR